MAEEANETPEERVLELTEEAQAPEESETEQPEAEEEKFYSFGDEAPPASEESNSTIREMRQALREKEAKIKELERSTQPQEIEIGPKPTMESCDYDEDRYDQEYDAWKKRQADAEAKKTEAQKAQERIRETFVAKVKAFGEQKDSLGVKDFADAEAEVRSQLNEVQQSVLIHGAKSKAALVYALGKNPATLRELASITDPIEFAFEAARLEAKMKSERRRPSTQPESAVRGGTGTVAQPDSKLSDRLSPEEWTRRRNQQLRDRRR